MITDKLLNLKKIKKERKLQKIRYKKKLTHVLLTLYYLKCSF